MNSIAGPDNGKFPAVATNTAFTATMSRILKPMNIAVFLVMAIALTGTAAYSQDTDSKTDATHGEFLGAMPTVYPDWFKTSFLELEEDVAEAAAAGKRLMLVFHQDGCPYCNAFVEKNLAQKDIVDTMQSKFDVIEINMWGDREVASVDGNVYTEKTFAAALKVQFTPTVLFLDDDGALALRINGYQNPDRFRLALRYVSEKMESKIAYSEFIKQNSQASTSSKLVERPYFTGPATSIANRPGKNEKPLLLFFEQGSCKNCDLLHDIVLADESSRALLSSFDSYQIDMWGRDPISTPDGQQTTGRQWSKELDISYAPTLILYDTDGTEVIRSEAWFKTFHTQSILDYVSSGAWKEQPSFQRFISARADAIRESGADVNIWPDFPDPD